MRHSIGDLIENKYLVLASYLKLVDNKELYVVYDFQTKQKQEYWRDKINYNWYCFCWATEYEHLEVVKFLVENGANIHANNDLALCWAAENGYLEIVKYLVENGANIHANNDCALRWAAYKGHLEVVKYLIENGADIHADNDSALYCIAWNGHLEVVKYLKSLK